MDSMHRHSKPVDVIPDLDIPQMVGGVGDQSVYPRLDSFHNCLSVVVRSLN